MVRLVKRYGSRKLYDTEESRYVSLEELGAWVRDGQEIRVIDNESNEDVSAQTLTQVILEEGRKGSSFPPTEILHEMIRRGGRWVSSGVDQVQSTMDKLLVSSLDRLGPVRKAREETAVLREKLEQLEASLAEMSAGDDEVNHDRRD